MTETRKQLPYGTFGMLNNCVERFKDSVVPTNLNRHVLDDLSGADYSALNAALRFFGLIDDRHGATGLFHSLVQAKKESDDAFKVALRKLLDESYGEVVKGVDVERGTLPDLEAAFRAYGVPQGQMLMKAVRFYVKALEATGFKVSEHITKPRRSSRKPNSKKGTPGPAPKSATKHTKDPLSKREDAGGKGSGDCQPGYEQLPIPMLPGAFIRYPVGLTVAQCTLLEGAVALLKASVEVSNKENR